MRKLSLIVSLFLPLVACDTAPSTGEADGAAAEPERGPLGKADAIGSCAASEGGDYCGGPTGEGNCWCDDLCEDYGDCCGDKAAVCDDEPAIEFCMQDDECDSGFCDHSECLSNCPDGLICPAVCWGQCGEPEPEPEPEPTPEPEPPPEPDLPAEGTVGVRGATLVRLDGEHGRYTEGRVPGGVYTVVVRMGGADYPVRGITVPPGGHLELSCNPLTLECREAQ